MKIQVFPVFVMAGFIPIGRDFLLETVRTSFDTSSLFFLLFSSADFFSPDSIS